MKQAVVATGIILVLAALGYWGLHREWTKDRGHQIGYALGNPVNGDVELHVVVSRQMTLTQGPRAVGGGVGSWVDWVKEHFELRDAAGQQIPMNRSGTSTVINEREAFNPEFYVWAHVRGGTTYTLDYIPVFGQPKRYRHTFTAAPEGQKFERIYFETVQAP
jgi:hypothetical protein